MVDTAPYIEEAELKKPKLYQKYSGHRAPTPGINAAHERTSVKARLKYSRDPSELSSPPHNVNGHLIRVSEQVSSGSSHHCLFRSLRPLCALMIAPMEFTTLPVSVP